MPEKKTASKSDYVNYVNTHAESAPFSLKVGDTTIKPVIQANNSFVWPIPKAILAQAILHTHLVTGRLIAEK